jgi:diguanylate cyclase (GGDEF)-like protein
MSCATFVAAIGVLLAFERLPRWTVHVLVLATSGLICWAIYESGRAGSPYKVFLTLVVVYTAFFMTPAMTAVHIGAIMGGYAAALIALGDRAQDPELHWATTMSALILVAVAIQALTGSVRNLIARLTEVGRADSLTGLSNAAAFNEMLDNEVERARRSGNRLGLVIAEIDNMPPVTGRAMSAAQQRGLAVVGELFRTVPRQIDMAARVGGNRFGVLLPYTDEHGAYLVAERMRSELTEAEPVDGERIQMSFGVAGFPRQGATSGALLQGAELALDEAQTAGGGRVMMLQRGASSTARVEIESSEGQLLG